MSQSHPPAAVTGSGQTQRFAPEAMNHHVLAMWAFISSEVFFFGSLIAVFLAARAAAEGGPRGEHLDVVRTAIFSIFLITSSVTVAIAINRLHANDSTGFRVWLVVTVALGLIFLGGQVTEYQALWAEGFTINRNIYFSAFYTLTGFHGLHVICGLLALIVVTGLAFAGDFGPHRDTAIETVSLYWHFVDVVWIVVFAVVYLGALFG